MRFAVLNTFTILYTYLCLCYEKWNSDLFLVLALAVVNSEVLSCYTDYSKVCI